MSQRETQVRRDGSHGWVTTFVIRHRAGSSEGAIFQRNLWDALIAGEQGEVVMANTQPGDATGAAMAEFFRLTEEEEMDS